MLETSSCAFDAAFCSFKVGAATCPAGARGHLRAVDEHASERRVPPTLIHRVSVFAVDCFIAKLQRSLVHPQGDETGYDL
jgi:hypothetical protein